MIKVFISYSHKDERYRNRLDTHLATLKREKLITSWSDHSISAGKTIDPEITKQLEEARIILLLISPDFIASDYCFTVELKRAIARHEEGTTRVIPIIAKPCDWHTSPFGKLKALPRDGKAIVNWSPIDNAYHDIVVKLRDVVREMNREGSDHADSAAPPSREPASSEAESVILESQLTVRTDVDIIARIGCPCLQLKLLCRSKRAARVAGAQLRVRGPHFVTGVQQAFSTDLGLSPDGPAILDEPKLFIDFHPMSRPDTAHGYVIEQGDMRGFFIPTWDGTMLDFFEAPPQDVSLVVRHIDGTEETLLSGLDIQRELPGLLRRVLDQHYQLRVPLTLTMGFIVNAAELPDIPSKSGLLNDQPLGFPPHPRRDLPVDAESDLIRLRAKILRAGGEFDKSSEDWLMDLVRTHPDREARRDAIVSLRRLATPSVRDFFLELLDVEHNENTRELIIRSFALVGTRDDVSRMEAMMKNEPSRFCREAAKVARWHINERYPADTSSSA